MYKKVQELSKKKPTAATTLLDRHCQLITDSKERQGCWKEHFCQKLSPAITFNPSILVSFQLLDYPVDPSSLSLQEEVVTAIQSLKTNIAPGPDDINPELKSGPEELVDIYHQVTIGI